MATYVTVLGNALWRERFGADPNVVGTTVLPEHEPYTIIGMMPPEFRFKLSLFEETPGASISTGFGGKAVVAAHGP